MSIAICKKTNKDAGGHAEPQGVLKNLPFRDTFPFLRSSSDSQPGNIMIASV